ncbi:hypothetical protein [Agarilytica rhodophyticola]|uniref:hypothetical protein n=1 Tax=Agarilytica rhodophyticola TaxID=1737490 RepID=UPI000B345F66|nr:hypothetical protein [Agarilytica rhodophyticola]
MNSQLLLSIIQKNYNFSKAYDVFKNDYLSKSWKQWFTTEMALLFSCEKLSDKISVEDYYCASGVDNDENSSARFLHYHAKTGVTKVMEKRRASRSDFSFECDGKTQHFEVRCSDSISLKSNRQLAIFENDMIRVEHLKKENPSLSINTIFVFNGNFENKDINLLKPLDNNKRCSYVLDTSLNGSTSIARLSQIKRNGGERLCVVAYDV